MKKFVVVLIVVMFSLNSFASEDAFDCKSITGIDEIKKYLTCSTSLSLAACGGLGAAVAGRTLSKRFLNKHNQYLKATQNSVSGLQGRINKINSKLGYFADVFGKDSVPYSKAPVSELVEKELGNFRTANGGIDKGLERYFRATYLARPPAEVLGALPGSEYAEVWSRPHGDGLARELGFDNHKTMLKEIDGKLDKVAKNSYQEVLSSRIREVDKLKVDERTKRILKNYLLEVDVERAWSSSRSGSTAVMQFPSAELQKIFNSSPEVSRFLNGTENDLHKSFIKNKSKLLKDPAYKRYVSAMSFEKNIDNALIGKNAKAHFDELVKQKALLVKQLDRLSAKNLKLHPSMRRLLKFGPIAGGAILGGGLFVVSEFAFGSTKTACSTLDSEFMHLSKDNNCQPDYTVNTNVSKFLSMTEEAQLEKLKNPNVCEYYSGLHSNVFKTPEISSVQCEGSRSFSYSYKDTRGVVVNNRVALNSSGQIAEIISRGYKLRYTDSGDLYKYEFPNLRSTSGLPKVRTESEFGSQSSQDEEAQKISRQAKLFLPEIASCCSSSTFDKNCSESFPIKGPGQGEQKNKSSRGVR